MYATRSFGYTEDSLDFEIHDPRKELREQVKTYSTRGCNFNL